MAAVAALAIGAAAAALLLDQVSGPGADPTDAVLVAEGQRIYDRHCAACHGRNLEGQPDWQVRRTDGRFPAPPHDESGHTWHHPDKVLFDIVREGITKYAPPGYRSDMPAYRGVLSERDVWAVLAYIKSKWPPQILERQQHINRIAQDR